jgi:hypothetical protein
VRNAFSRWLVLGAFSFAAACSSPTPFQSAQRSDDIPLAGLPTSSTEHLYVIVTASRRFVAEYPIRNGIPAAKPDRMVLGFSAPNALTVDSAGNLYVLDRKAIKEFAPGASGRARPARKLEVPSFLNINTLAVDAQGYLYVGQSAHVYVYAPGAHGRATPIAKIKPVGYPAGFALDADDEFYTLGNTQTYDPYLEFQMHVTVYSAAPALQRIRKFCTPVFTNHGIDYGIALDGHGTLFTTHTYFISSYPSGEIDIYPQDAKSCPRNPSAVITTTNPTLRVPVYVAVDAPYLYVGDVFYGNGGVVFTLQTTGSRQQPLSTLYVEDNQPHNVFGIALGP